MWYNRKVSFGVILGGLSIIISGLSGLIVYPLLLQSLTKEIAGLWLFFNSFSAILNLGQAGLGPIIVRRSAAALILRNDLITAKFIDVVKKTFTIVVWIVIVICVLLYFFYIKKVITSNSELYRDGLVSWLLFSISNALTIYSSRKFYVMNGFGEVGWDKMNQILISVFIIVGYYFSLHYGFGLVGLSIVFLMSSLLNVISSNLLFQRVVAGTDVSGINLKSSWNDTFVLFKEGANILILNVMGIIIMNKDIFLVERFLGLSVVPSFNALSRIQGIVIMVSSLFPQMLFPFVSQAFTNKDFVQTKKYYLQGVLMSVLVAIFLSISLLVFANSFFAAWLGPDNFLGNKILFLLLVLAVIYVHHAAHASAVISTGENSFVWPAVLNGVLSLPLSYVGIKFFGIEGMILGNLVATILPSIYVVNFSVRYFNNLLKLKIN